jgi:hypothetical protein
VQEGRAAAGAGSVSESVTCGVARANVQGPRRLAVSPSGQPVVHMEYQAPPSDTVHYSMLYLCHAHTRGPQADSLPPPTHTHKQQCAWQALQCFVTSACTQSMR